MHQSRRIKVLHITRSEIAGVRVFLAGLLARTDRTLFEVKVAAPLKGPLVRDLEPMNVPALYCPMARDIDPLSDLGSFLRVCRLLWREKPDVLHLHGAKAGFLGRVAGWLLRVPAIVYTPNNDYLGESMTPAREWLLCALERVAARLGARIVSVSQEERQSWIRRKICAPENIITIYDGFDFARAASLIPQEEAKHEIGIPEQCGVVGLIARLVLQKAPHIFLEAAARVLRHRPDVWFLVVGDGPLRGDLERLAARLGISGQVLFLGNREDLSVVYSAMDVEVLTSLYEGLPMVVLEAMYLGIPVVVSKTHGVTELLREDCGVITPVLDPGGTARGILTIFEDPEEASRMAERARARVLEQFCAERMTAQYQDLYLRLLESSLQPDWRLQQRKDSTVGRDLQRPPTSDSGTSPRRGEQVRREEINSRLAP